MKKLLVLSLVLMLALVAGVAFSAFRPRTDESLLFEEDKAYAGWVGKTAQLKFNDMDGRGVDLEKLRGKVVLLDFWATWCGPCMKELPRVKATYEKFHGKGFEIVGISFDPDKTSLETVVRDQKIPWSQFFDPAGRDNKFGKQFGISHYPSMWLVDKRGEIRYISAGKDMEEKISTLLAESGTQTSGSSFSPTKLLGQCGSFVAKLWPSKKSGSTKSPANSGVTIIHQEPVAGITDTVAQKEAGMLEDTTVTQAGLRALNQVSIRGIVESTRSSAVVTSGGGRDQTVLVGDEFNVKTSDGFVVLRCEKIETRAVWVRVPKTTMLAELRLP